MMTNPVSSATESLIQRILELSADAQIQRYETPAASLRFHQLTGAILAYGKLLRILTKAELNSDEQYLLIKPMQSAASGAGGAL